jgi:hypothetical protein
LPHFLLLVPRMIFNLLLPPPLLLRFLGVPSPPASSRGRLDDKIIVTLFIYYILRFIIGRGTDQCQSNSIPRLEGVRFSWAFCFFLILSLRCDPPYPSIRLRLMVVDLGVICQSRHPPAMLASYAACNSIHGAFFAFLAHPTSTNIPCSIPHLPRV